MKKALFLLFAISSLTLQAQTDTTATQKKEWPTFLTSEQMLDGSAFLPAPPVFGSDTFVSDMVWNYWGKSLRDTPRGEQARRDADTKLQSVMQLFSEPFGTELSQEQTPELAYLLERVKNDSYTATRKAKRHFNRQRPFLYFNEGTLIPEEEETHQSLHHNDSQDREPHHKSSPYGLHEHSLSMSCHQGILFCRDWLSKYGLSYLLH